MANWWDIYDLDQVCLYPDYVTFNKGEWGRLHALMTAGEPEAEQEYLQFKQISEIEFKKLRLIAGCDEESSVTIDIKGKGQSVGFVPMTPETGGSPVGITGKEPQPVGTITGTPESYPPGEAPEFYEPTGGMPEPYEPQGYQPGAGGYQFPESTEGAPGFAIPDVGFQTEGSEGAEGPEVDGALAKEEVATGLEIPVARPERPLVWVGILAMTTAGVVGSLYLWNRFASR